MKKWEDVHEKMDRKTMSCEQLSLVFCLPVIICPVIMNQQAEAAVQEELRGVWIASVYNIDFPEQAGDFYSADETGAD